MKRAMTYFIIVLGVIIVAVIGTGSYLSSPGYTGEESDHFDGSKFFNPTGKGSLGAMAAMKWSFNRDPGEWVKKENTPYGEAPPERSSSMRITFINHSTFLLQVDNVNILTDPVYSKRTSPFQWIGPERMRPPGIRFEDLPPIDVVLISHNHYDHLDEATIKRLKQEHDPQFVVALGISGLLERFGIDATTDLDWWGSLVINDQLTIEAVPAQHFSGRGLFDTNKTLWCGFVIKRSQGNIYFAGDTGYDEEMFNEIAEKCSPLALSMIPIGAYKPNWFMSSIHISPEEAVKIHQLLKSPKSIGIHFGTFPLADDGQTQPIHDLQKAKASSGLNDEDFIVLDEGKSYNQ